MLASLKKYWYVAVVGGFALLAAGIGISDVQRHGDYTPFIAAGIFAAIAVLLYILGKKKG